MGEAVFDGGSSLAEVADAAKPLGALEQNVIFPLDVWTRTFSQVSSAVLKRIRARQ